LEKIAQERVAVALRGLTDVAMVGWSRPPTIAAKIVGVARPVQQGNRFPEIGGGSCAATRPLPRVMRLEVACVVSLDVTPRSALAVAALSCVISPGATGPWSLALPDDAAGEDGWRNL
jgi:hypothetical protein